MRNDLIQNVEEAKRHVEDAKRHVKEAFGLFDVAFAALKADDARLARMAANLRGQSFQALLNEAMPDVRIVGFDGSVVKTESQDFPEDGTTEQLLSSLLIDLGTMMREGGC